MLIHILSYPEKENIVEKVFKFKYYIYIIQYFRKGVNHVQNDQKF
jgi:hypothetical protein